MKKLVTYSFVFFLALRTLYAQDLDVDGSIKLGTAPSTPTSDSIVVQLDDGRLGIRPASTLTSGSSAQHYIGELFGGGIVFSVWDNGTHGLIASLGDLGTGLIWGGEGQNIIGATSILEGGQTTPAIVAALDDNSGISYAAKLCEDYNGGNMQDWYLPAIWELLHLQNQAMIINKKLDNDGDPLSTVLPVNTSYWSSTQFSEQSSWGVKLFNGEGALFTKSSFLDVRAIRSF